MSSFSLAPPPFYISKRKNSQIHTINKDIAERLEILTDFNATITQNSTETVQSRKQLSAEQLLGNKAQIRLHIEYCSYISNSALKYYLQQFCLNQKTISNLLLNTEKGWVSTTGDKKLKRIRGL